MISVIKSNDGLKLRRVAPSAAMLQLDRNASGYHGERGDDASNSLFEITQHQFRRQMQHAIPEPPKQAPSGVSVRNTASPASTLRRARNSFGKITPAEPPIGRTVNFIFASTGYNIYYNNSIGLMQGRAGGDGKRKAGDTENRISGFAEFMRRGRAVSWPCPPYRGGRPGAACRARPP